MTLLSDSDSPLLCFSQKDGLSASFPPLLPPPLAPDFAVLSHGPADLPDTQTPTRGGSIRARYFLIHCTQSIPLLCSKTVFGSLVLIQTSARMISPFVSPAWSLASVSPCRTPFLSVKLGYSPALPPYASASPVHICSSCTDGFIFHDELFTSRPATASLQLLPSLSPTIAFSISSAVWLLC